MHTINTIEPGLIAEEEFAALTAMLPNGCIEWRGSLDSKGYGRFKRDGRQYFAHRVALALAGVDLGENDVDHLCRNRRCVNPDHLEPVSTKENTARGNGATAAAIRARRDGECVNGHVIAEVGEHRQGDGFTCAECGRDRVRRYKARKANR